MRVSVFLSNLVQGSRSGGCKGTRVFLHSPAFQNHHERSLRGFAFSRTAPPLRVAVLCPDASAAALSSSSSDAAAEVSVVEFLTESFGFSPEEATRVSERLKRLKTPRNAESVLVFLKGKGASEAAVREAISRRPTLLYVDVEKNLAPKFSAFEEIGFSGTELLKTLGRNSSFLHYSLERKLMPNIALLQKECGIPGRRIFKVLRRSSRLVGRSTSSLKDLIGRVRELGFSKGSVAFETCLHVADSLSRSTVNDKLAFLKSLGWTEEETLRAIHRYPLILGLSEKKLRDAVEFFVKEIGRDASFLAANAVLLTFSIDKRVKPRYQIYQILQKMKVPEGGWSLLSLFSVSESVFLSRFVLKYADRHPELKEAYDNAGFETKLRLPTSPAAE